MNDKKKILIITNIPSPYRVDLFYYMQTNIKEYDFHVIYTKENESNRNWKVDYSKLLNTQILKSKEIVIKGKDDDRHIHIPYGLTKSINKVKPDVIIAFEYNLAAIKSLIWCKIHKKKFIHLTDGTLYSEINIGKMQKLNRLLIIKNCDAAIASSTRAKEKLLQWGGGMKKRYLLVY